MNTCGIRHTIVPGGLRGRGRGSYVAMVVLVVLSAGCAFKRSQSWETRASDAYGVLVMAHGGSEEWNRAVQEAVAPLRRRYPTEIAFGMADAVTIQDAVTKLEERGVRKIGVVRLFVSGESWFERTEQILGLREGRPPDSEEPGSASGHQHHSSDGPAEPAGQDRGGHDASSHRMAFFRVVSQSFFALSTEGLAEVEEMGEILAERVKALSRAPQAEDVLILAHGPADDEENQRWIARIELLARRVKQSAEFQRVEVMTLREDWPEKREGAEERIRGFVRDGLNSGRRVIVVPFRVYGFGPYAQVLEGLEYVADGKGLLPHPHVSQWMLRQAEALGKAPFRAPIAAKNTDQTP